MTTACPFDSRGAATKALISVADTQLRLAQAANCRLPHETLPLEECQGRILARNLAASIRVPPWDNSAMDGYGFRHADLQPGRYLPVSGRVAAGDFPRPLSAGTAVRIFTGAPVPAGVDTVVPQERVIVSPEGRVAPEALPSLGQNIRRAGEDTEPGQRLLETGTRLEAAELGIIAGQGIATLPVFRRLRVSLLTTGDELIEPGLPLGAGQIHNSNRYQLTAALKRLGCEVQSLHVPDSLAKTRCALSGAATESDLIMTCGGVSVGEEDHVRRAVQELGAIRFRGIAIKPGKPFAFGEVAGTPLMGLPGNPMAALVTFEILAMDYIRRLMGERFSPLIQFPVTVGFDRSAVTARQEYLRVCIDSSGLEPRAFPTGSQSSGVMSVASRCDGYLVVPPNQAIEIGGRYGFIPRSQFRA